MEQTLGKRIAENRKKMKMTQDQLAEHLGITAQAVSKWENDQSCPDITMLPRLAEIFGITTDELLGHETKEKVHDAEVVQESSEHDDGINVHWDSDNDNGKWEFHWDSGKRGALTFATLVLLVGVLTLLSKINGWGASFWDILWPSGLLVYGLAGILKRFSFFNLGLTLFGGYYLIENLDIWELNIAGELIFPIIVVMLGISLLIDALKKPKKPRFSVTHNGKRVGHGGDKTRCDCSNGSDSFNCSLSFGENTHFVSLPCLACGDASVNFGELRVDLSGCEAVREGCTVNASCSFGELVILVPRRFRVEPDSSTAFASVSINGHPDVDPQGIIYLDANVSFGEICVQYI